MNRELGLYLELQNRLDTSRRVFQEFVNEGVANRGGLFGSDWTGARCLPGWSEFVLNTALPLNRDTFEVIEWIDALTPELPIPLQAFVAYHTAFEEKYADWMDGKSPNWDFTAGHNFPSHLDSFVRSVIAALSTPKIHVLTDSDGHTFTKVGSVKQDDRVSEVWTTGSNFLTITFKASESSTQETTMARQNRVATFLAGLGIGTGIGIGATLGAMFSREPKAVPHGAGAGASNGQGGAFPDSYGFPFNNTTPDAPFMSDEKAAQALAELETLDTESVDATVDAEHLNDTPELSPAATLIDSLQGIEVSGESATLVKVRVLGVERAKYVAMWGTKGVDGNSPTVFKRLIDLTTEHLVNIREKSVKVSEDEKVIIESILEDRVAAGTDPESVLAINS
jgi:hypothetical protein